MYKRERGHESFFSLHEEKNSLDWEIEVDPDHNVYAKTLAVGNCRVCSRCTDNRLHPCVDSGKEIRFL